MLKTSICLIASLFLCAAAQAAVLYVSTAAENDGNGTREQPFRSIQSALDKARPGDTVELAPGIYRERVRFRSGGKFQKPIRLNGPREAVIDASEDIPLNWLPAPEAGPLAYRAAVSRPVYSVTCPEGTVIILNERRVTPGLPETVGTKTDRQGTKWIWDWKHNLRCGVGRYGWEAVKALAMYRRKSGELYLAFGNGRDPRKIAVTVSPKEAAVTIDGADWCVVSGITIRNAWYGVLLSDTFGSTVENCRIERTDFGVQMIEGARQCTVRFCDISYDPLASADPHEKGSWDIWQAHKTGGFYDRIGVNMLRTSGGHRIHDNYIHDHWGGIQDTGEAGQNGGLEVHHNRIHNISDDGLEPDGAEENCRWYSNVVSRSLCGFRIKCVRKGPLYAYGNLFFQNKEDFRNFGTKNLAKAIVYVYFNTSTSRAAVKNNAVPPHIGTPNYHYFNNIFYCEHLFVPERPDLAAPDWQEKGNLFIRRGKNPLWERNRQEAAKRNFGKNSRYLTDVSPGFRNEALQDFSITADSPARNAGADISMYGLPGLDTFLRKDGSSDAGALPFGTPMLCVPRSPEAVRAPPAGFF